MLHWWWKILGAVLLLYVLIISLITPLAPGIVNISQTTISPGATTFEITGYNTQFDEASDLQVWLTNGKHQYCGSVTDVMSSNKLKVQVELDSVIPETFFHLFVNSLEQGTLFYPEAFYAKAFEISSEDIGTAEECIEPIVTVHTSGLHFPNRAILNETIRNLMFHVPMWFTMFFLMGISMVQGIRYLGNSMLVHDIKAEQSVRVGLLFAVLGLITGSIWARFTWNTWWVSDPQLNGAAVTFLMYVAYLILRSSIDDEDKRARVSAVYNIFAFAMLVVLLLILPRFTDSLHPGKGGNPAFSKYDLDSALRMVFYPAVVGWILLGYWIYNIRYRIASLQQNNES
jgi:heme exporter protein C